MIEIISSLSTVMYAITFLIIINEVKKTNLQSVKSALTNPLWPTTKVSTIYGFYLSYYETKGFSIVILLNIISFFITMIGLVLIILGYGS
jgi:hypothetical protein